MISWFLGSSLVLECGFLACAFCMTCGVSLVEEGNESSRSLVFFKKKTPNVLIQSTELNYKIHGRNMTPLLFASVSRINTSIILLLPACMGFELPAKGLGTAYTVEQMMPGTDYDNA